ncbi:carboxylating nicotinate-nucleotide diphosphorylase [Spirochaetia bacterium 38H-sp]|uniref:nicotinate-nucleotide diphosphorylase (carboxylating) n=1 Tax=Rarispira pelagica TaxID=3141764 RepID=A0ABU9UEE1_9SPIR
MNRFEKLCERFSSEIGLLVPLALKEDLSDVGDVTSDAIFDESTFGEAVLVSKGDGVLAGDFLFDFVCRSVCPDVTVEFYKEDGDILCRGDVVARIRGPVRYILRAERVALNFIAFLSGIATETKRFVDAASKYGRVVILDTRKTLPGYRRLSKYAVMCGGGSNHRMGLFDMVMIKDNHVDAAGSISAAVERVRSVWGDRFRVEVECRSVSDVEEAVSAGADIVMLDNMDADECAVAVKRFSGRVKFEASGDMSIERLSAFAASGVDYISVGRITHSAPAFNFSVKYSN